MVEGEGLKLSPARREKGAHAAIGEQAHNPLILVKYLNGAVPFKVALLYHIHAFKSTCFPTAFHVIGMI